MYKQANSNVKGMPPANREDLVTGEVEVQHVTVLFSHTRPVLQQCNADSKFDFGGGT